MSGLVGESFDGRPECELLVADQHSGAAIPNTDGWRETKHQREAAALFSEVPHSNRDRYSLNVGETLRVSAERRTLRLAFRVRNRDCGADQQAGALPLKLREDGSPACLVHSIPAWND